MDGNFYQNPTFPTLKSDNNEKTLITNSEQMSLPDAPMKQSFIENILRNNKGKKVKAYVSFANSNDSDKTFEGTIEQAGKDHIIMKDSNTGSWFLIPMIYLNYLEFDEKIDYTIKDLF